MLCGKVLAPLSRAALQSRVIGFPNGGRVFAIIKALGRQPSMHNISQARFYRTSPCILKRRENAFDDVEGGRRYRRGNEYEDNQDGYPMQERKKWVQCVAVSASRDCTLCPLLALKDLWFGLC